MGKKGKEYERKEKKKSKNTAGWLCDEKKKN
jgi:hypothetical protein